MLEAIARWSALFLRATALEDAAAFDYIDRRGNFLDINANARNQPN